MCVCVCVHEVLKRVWNVLSVSVCARVYHRAVSVEVVSARRGNLLYKRRADVSYVYPRSHSTKEPCIPNHFNPRPSLSWFSDINNFLFHFASYIPPLLFFSARRSQRWTEEGFAEQILISDHFVWEGASADERCHGAQTTSGDLRLLWWCFPNGQEPHLVHLTTKRHRLEGRRGQLCCELCLALTALALLQEGNWGPAEGPQLQSGTHQLSDPQHKQGWTWDRHIPRHNGKRNASTWSVCGNEDKTCIRSQWKNKISCKGILCHANK